MLTRAARRQLRPALHRALHAGYNQLAPPFLCPSISRHAVARRPSSRAASTTLASRTAKHRSSSPSPAHDLQPQARRLATAADAPYHGGVIAGSSFDYIPFEGAPSTPHATSSGVFPFGSPEQPVSELRKRDMSNPANLVILPDAELHNKPLTIRAKQSIAGELAVLQQNVYACVQVGRFDRARTLVRHMTASLDPTTPELHDVHLRYISGHMDQFLDSPSKERLAGLQKWIELDMRAHGIPLGHQIIAYILKASLLALSGARLDRSLRRYLGWAEEAGDDQLEAVLADGIFTEREWETLMKTCGRPWNTAELQDPVNLASATKGTTNAELEDYEPSIVLTDLQTAPDTPNHQESPLSATSELSELKAVPQKGLGLRSVKESLAALNSHSTSHTQPSLDSDSKMLLQERLESDVMDTALRRWREEAQRSTVDRIEGRMRSVALGAHVYRWVKDITATVEAELQRAEELVEGAGGSKEDRDLFLILPFMRLVDTEKAVASSVVAFMATFIDNDWKDPIGDRRHNQTFTSVRISPLRDLLPKMGQAVLHEARAERVLQANNMEKLTKLASHKRRSLVAKIMGKSRNAQTTTGTSESTEKMEALRLSSVLKIKIAALMLTALLKHATLPGKASRSRSESSETDMQPVAKHAYWYKDGKKHGIVEISEELVDRLKKEPPIGFLAKWLPMLSPPRRWEGLRTGGYLTADTDIVRVHTYNASSSAYLKVAHRRGDLGQVYSALDGLGEVPWRINRRVYDTMAEVWNSGQGLGNLAPADPQLALPQEPNHTDVKAHMRWKAEIKNVQNQLSSYHSQRCFQNFQLEIARAFLDNDFFCPHNMDFRGRAYPIPPYLNHMGPDYVRSLFRFSKGRELGERGLFWLKVHLSNVAGYDKATFEDRAKYADDHITDIYDSAERPLEGKRWWLKSDDPWQTLAACMELHQALESPVPTQFISHLPIQMDGSCNGLQHYAALGGDALGAKQVSLEPGDKPGDIYTGVLDMVKKDVAQDAEKGDHRAITLTGRLTRKCVKQPVMTNVYGVTFIGASAQVKRQLVDIIPKEEVRSGKADLRELSLYLARLIFKSLRTMFSGAHAIQEWFGECGDRISRSITPEQLNRIKKNQGLDASPTKKTNASHRAKENKSWMNTRDAEDYQFKSPIVWTTPLGLPVVQPYRDQRTQLVETSMQKLQVPVESMSDAVNKRKQLQGLPPNFIHSLDASHMMLTALRFQDLGLTFAAIHDAFWTHAADIDALNTELRSTFISMHSENVVERLREEFAARYKGCFHWDSVPLDSKVGQLLNQYYRKYRPKKAPIYRRGKIRSPEIMDDALVEQERQRLLASEDPDEVAYGRDIITPASIVEEEEAKAIAESRPTFVRSDVVDPIEDVAAADEQDHEAFSSDFDASVSVMSEQSSEIDDAATASDPESESGLSSGLENETKEPAKAKKKLQYKAFIYFWRPLVLPPAPEKGTFDVSRVRDSRYFFS